jgi:hypothetical protein
MLDNSSVTLFVPKLRLVWITWCKIDVVLSRKCQRRPTIWKTSEIIAILVQMTLRILYWFLSLHRSWLRRLPP